LLLLRGLKLLIHLRLRVGLHSSRHRIVGRLSRLLLGASLGATLRRLI
jgi:hypothetical protein